MKNKLLLIGTLCGLIATANFAPPLVQVAFPAKKEITAPSNYEAAWRKVDSLGQRGLTQSALKVLDELYSKARSEHNAPQLIKTVIHQLKYQDMREEDSFVKGIKKMQHELDQAKAPLTNILHSATAEMYWWYYNRHRWQMMQRTEVKGLTIEDIEAWDLKRLTREIAKHYDASLQSVSVLQQTPTNSFNEVLVAGNDNDALRPTLYDFLAQRAIEFYLNGEAGLSRPVHHFQLNDPTYSAPFDAFLKWTIPVPEDTNDYHYKALVLLKNLMHFHEQDTAAFIDLDLQRLKLVQQEGQFADKNKELNNALQFLFKTYQNHPSSTEILFELAQLSMESGNQYQPLVSADHKWDKKQAATYCKQAISTFPKAYGALRCNDLLQQLELPVLELQMEAVTPIKEKFKALVRYANINSFYYRIIALSPEMEKKTEGMSHRELQNYFFKQAAIKEGEQTLTNDGDLQQHATELAFDGLGAGHYVMLNSYQKLASTTSPVYFTDFTISNLSFLGKANDNNQQEVHVFDRETGMPMGDVRVILYTRRYDRQSRSNKEIKVGSSMTDKNGKAIITGASPGQSYSYELIKGNDRLHSEHPLYFSHNHQPQENISDRIHFFTDRSLYRPGQIVHFKGIVVRSQANNRTVVTNQPYTIALHDPNGQQISSLDLKTNDYGTFNGTFVLPTGKLNGAFSIRSTAGSHTVQVEEYKRPKFQLEFSPLQGSYKLGSSVTVEGNATAYSGAPLDGAAVSYRIVRKPQYHPFYYYHFFPPLGQEYVVQNGTLSTDDQGNFSIAFKTQGNDNPEANGYLQYNYEITAEVTDINGETQSNSTQVTVGQQALILSAAIGDKVNLEKPAPLEITSTNLNGQFEATKGRLRILKLDAGNQYFRERLWATPDLHHIAESNFRNWFPHDPYQNEQEVKQYKVVETMIERAFNTAQNKQIVLPEIAKWPEGIYRVELSATDAFGEEIKWEKTVQCFRENSKKLPGPQLDWFVPLNTSGEPGENAVFLIGSSTAIRVLFEVEHQNQVVSSKWIQLNNEQKRIEIPIEEKHRGNFAYHLTFIRHSRHFQHSQIIQVPYSDKALNISMKTFRDKLVPGGKEEWTFKVTDANDAPANVEMLTSMYDAALDAFLPHDWYFDVFPRYHSRYSWNSGNSFGSKHARFLSTPSRPNGSSPYRIHEHLNWFGYQYHPYHHRLRGSRGLQAPASMNYIDEAFSMEGSVEMETKSKLVDADVMAEEAKTETNDNNQPKAVRSNFSETAFFYPQLKTNEKGELHIAFTLPESLTKWKLQALAHSKTLQFGQLQKSFIAQKELMAVANPPRFLREGDTLFLSAKVTNLSEGLQGGEATVQFRNALTQEDISTLLLGSDIIPQTFQLEKGKSTALHWKVRVPEGIGAIVYRIEAKSNTHADGEEHVLPVLSNRMLVTESLPLPMKGTGTKSFSFEKLLKSGTSTSIRHERLTLEYTANPAWYAVQALPYLMEYPYECAEQVFSRFYANSLGAKICRETPAISRVFEQWKSQSPEALQSNLEKNQELKALLLEETPWVLQARDESERKRRISLLFDLNTMSNQQYTALQKLNDMQTPEGGWPWFKGMRPNAYITQHIVTGLGKLKKLGAIEQQNDPVLMEMLQKGVQYIDAKMNEDYQWLKNHNADLSANHLSQGKINYLYARSFTLDMLNYPIAEQHQEAYNYYRDQAIRYWPKQNHHLKGMIALALHRHAMQFQHKPSFEATQAIMASLKENALHHEEFGMYWKATNGYYWYEAPIERQALLIEAFREIERNQDAVAEMQVWLLKQKQTQDWKTTKATADACYALLLGGNDLLNNSTQVRVTLGKETVDPQNDPELSQEAGTGYFKKSWNKNEVNPEMGNITISNETKEATDPSKVSWGAVYWQYFEDLDKITPHETPLSLRKQLFIQRKTAGGLVIEPLTSKTKVKVGDLLKVRVELRVDRNMEYVHMKDMRASGLEPIDVISGYRYQDGLGYYQSTRDAATNFFFDYLPKGTYVFEYALRANIAGTFSNGITQIQCMYAPEFGAHSSGTRLSITP
jgi:uncharacterized protein YfaS (alpha-2-macroglobulin family)